jgi:hypothetical protein
MANTSEIQMVTKNDANLSTEHVMAAGYSNKLVISTPYCMQKTLVNILTIVRTTNN